jgi:hypothetical protein
LVFRESTKLGTSAIVLNAEISVISVVVLNAVGASMPVLSGNNQQKLGCSFDCAERRVPTSVTKTIIDDRIIFRR